MGMKMLRCVAGVSWFIMTSCKVQEDASRAAYSAAGLWSLHVRADLRSVCTEEHDWGWDAASVLCSVAEVGLCLTILLLLWPWFKWFVTIMCSLPVTEMLGQCHNTAIKWTLIIMVKSWPNIYLSFSVLCLVYYCLLCIWVSDKVYAILLKIKVIYRQLWF